MAEQTNFAIRQMREEDRAEVLAMMRVFYASPAVISDLDEGVIERDFNACLNADFPLDGYVFTDGQNILGYAMVSTCFSTEYGGKCVWLEDLYVKAECRGKGIAKLFFEFFETTYKDAAVFKLEVEAENVGAVNVYKRHGYSVMGYDEMMKKA